VNEAYAKRGKADWRLDSLWEQLRGGEIVSSRTAMGFATVRNLITSAALGTTALAAMATDPFIANVTKRLSGMPQRFWVTEVARTFFGGLSRPEAIRAGLESNVGELRQDGHPAGSSQRDVDAAQHLERAQPNPSQLAAIEGGGKWSSVEDGPVVDHVPNKRSPKSPRPGTMNFLSFKARSTAAV
jgi:hypothetical protein